MSAVVPSPDAVVVGAGIVGAACALELVRAGLRVVVLDGAEVGGGTTAAGMGHLVVMDDSEEQFALTAYSVRLWRELAPGLPPECEFDPCGTLWIAADAGQLEAVRRKHEAYTARGVAAEVLDGAALAACEPGLRRPLAGALLVPGDGVLYPPAAARYLLAEACRAGAVFRGGSPVEAIRPGAVVVAGETLPAGAVVNAAGAAAPSLAPGLPIVPRKGHLAITDRYPGSCRHQIVELGYLQSAHEMTAESVAFNVQPRKTGQVLIGSSRELVGWDPATNRAVLGRMLQRAVSFMPALASASVIRVWTGFRPATPDKLPLIGRWEETEGVWVAAGHEGLGITTSLGTARILADLITGRPPAIDPAPYAPMRVLSAAEHGE
ncbi:MAG TPA: FAD-dependent oxidoreductase [Longimicrobiales bacterium]|nr:FAD-dependent oxidoreductase [Longimicrobiales bacterium]